MSINDQQGHEQWPARGARVAVYEHAREVQVARVERLTDTQIVLDDGRKFRRDRLTEVGQPYGKRLKRLADPVVVETRTAQILDRLTTNAGGLRNTLFAALDGCGPSACLFRGEDAGSDVRTIALRGTIIQIRNLAEAALAEADDTAEFPTE
jgi:hypothetical protein